MVILSWCHLLYRKTLWLLLGIIVLLKELSLLEGWSWMTLKAYSAFMFNTTFMSPLSQLCCRIHKWCIYFLANMVIFTFDRLSSQSRVLALNVCYFLQIDKFFVSLKSHSSFKVYLKLRFSTFWSASHIINLLRVL